MTVLNHIKILPLLVIVALLSFIVRAGTFVSDGIAFAQEEMQTDVPPLPSEAAAAAAAKSAEKPEAAKAEPAAAPPPAAADKAAPAAAVAGKAAAPAAAAKTEDWKDSTDADIEFSEVQSGIYKDLAKRREELDKREKELKTREALLEAGKRELDQKLQEMTVIRNQIEGLLEQQSEQEKARVQSLVKIYEGMKAKDAAAVFNTLDMDILVSLLQNMSERKTAPIMAIMDPERVREVTTILAQQNQVPAIPGE